MGRILTSPDRVLARERDEAPAQREDCSVVRSSVVAVCRRIVNKEVYIHLTIALTAEVHLVRHVERSSRTGELEVEMRRSGGKEAAEEDEGRGAHCF